MLQMNQHYEPEFKKKIVRLHLEEGRSLKGLAAAYDVSKASISIWVKQFREECQTNEEAKADYDYMKENLQLKKQLAELQNISKCTYQEQQKKVPKQNIISTI